MGSESYLLYVALLFGFYTAWNIGANDVANAMGTSVGSRALTLKQAVILAAIFEFLGAVLFGSNVSKTLESGLLQSSSFAGEPLVLVHGMLAALLATGLWLQFASYCGLPVSTTHSIVGAIIGFGLVAGGLSAINWENVISIAISWVISPLLGALISTIIFLFLRKKIFYDAHPLRETKRLLPYLTAAVIIVLTSGMLHQIISKETHLYIKCTIVILPAVVVAYITYHVAKRINPKKHAHENNPKESEFALMEKIFGFLQISSACLMAFAHGSNDVSNAIGPMTAIVEALKAHNVNAHPDFPAWALILGGAGIVIGLATWGWRVIETIGKKITELTPSRGFSAEFGAALTILLASRLGLPVSTTHTLVGSVFGIGLAGGLSALNLNTLKGILLSWLITIPAGAILAILCYYVLSAIL